MKQGVVIFCAGMLAASLALVLFVLAWQTRQERYGRAAELRASDPRAYAVPADVQMQDSPPAREKATPEGTAGMMAAAPTGEWLRERVESQEILAAQARRHADALAKMKQDRR